MQRLTVSKATKLNSTNFHQSIRWEEVRSVNQIIESYKIRYGQYELADNYNSEHVQNTTSTTNSTTLTLPLPTSPTTYNVWVAAVGNKTGEGEYSQVLQINYSGMYLTQL